MKTIIIAVLVFVGCGGCVAEFTLETEPEPVGEATAADPTEAVYPANSAVVPKPPAKPTRPAPGQGRSR